MVMLGGRGSGTPKRPTPGRTLVSQLGDPRRTRKRGLDPEDGKNRSEARKKQTRKRRRSVIRKSLRLLSAAGDRRGRLRRSSRRPKPTSSRSVMAEVDSVRRRLHRGGAIFDAGRRRTAVPPQRQFNNAQQEKSAGDDSRQEGAADQDSDCRFNQNFDAKQSRASSLYQGVSPEFLRGICRISASGPNTTRSGTFRPTKSSWLYPSDDDDSDDEDHNRKLPSRCRPLGLRTDDLLGTRKSKLNVGASLADIDPMAVDQSVGFDNIGGLSGHISALKEMVVFPLLYPEVFDNFKIQPPRGCLFYGPPGTGKTLVARALANECSHGNRKVAFFMRKGADCLSKWVGESERQLRLLFEQAYQMRPSIIFFDEIDGLAPVRSSRQDQIHSSIVTTLLALMDGLDSRGEVVVIGATNRLDSIDPALRRPGRFDREFLFGLPDRESRKEILKIHTSQWKPPPSEDFLDELAERCVGYCGADIRAVCTEAALCALRRRYPQIYTTSQKLLLDVSSIAVSSCDFVLAMKNMCPTSQRSTTLPAKPLSPVVRPLLGAVLRDVLEALQRLFPHAEQGMERKREPGPIPSIHDKSLIYGGEEGSSGPSISTPSKNRNFLHFARVSGPCDQGRRSIPDIWSAAKHPTSHRPRMLLVGCPGAGQTSHLAPAVLHTLERFTIHSLDSAVLFGVSNSSPEEVCAQVFCEARRTSPSVLFVPHIQQWWEVAGPVLRASFLSLLGSIPSFSPILLLATTSIPFSQLDPDVQSLFREAYGEVYTVRVPTRQERIDFFQDLILNQAAEAPPTKHSALTPPPELLPLAPPPRPHQLTEVERLYLDEQEEDVLLELRLFLRSVTERLSMDSRFKVFAKPVDMEKVPNYPTLIKKPMDLFRLQTNIDEHKYATVSEFLSDADLIWQNALQCNPDSDAMDPHIRHRAYALKDVVHAIIKSELDKDLERFCEEIKELRIQRASSCTDFNSEEVEHICISTLTGNSPSCRKKRYKLPRKSKWSNGIISKAKKKKQPVPASCSTSSSSSKSEHGLEENRFVFSKGVNGFADQTSSTMSESSDGEQNHLSGRHRVSDFPGVRGTHSGVLMNGYHSSSPPKADHVPSQDLRRQTQTSRMMANGVCLSSLERHRPQGNRANKAGLGRGRPFSRVRSVKNHDDGTRSLVAHHNKLRDVLNRAVAKTDRAEMELLEKLYALLAQCIYRHRNNHGKTELLQEMNKVIGSFS
ncbi:ATPase family AAA domain-containing protein 2-like isoform 2-T3 [Aulostomus maculatus]